jgi:hypothetical protein
MQTLSPLVSLLSYVLLPLWLLAGLGDWLCHRRTGIEYSSGTREAAMHIALYLSIAVPVSAVMFVELTASLLVALTLAALAHTALSLQDNYLTQRRRRISPIEQLVHGHLDLLPWFAVAIAYVSYMADPNDISWRFELRAKALPGTAFVLALLAAGLAVPLQEFWRCARVAARAPHY